MLLAVEGGGFFSSSASGYSKGLTLLLLGQKNEEKPVRASQWDHYQLVSRESDPELQLASTKGCLSHGCASFACFGCTSSGLDSPSPQLGSIQHQDILPELLVSDEVENPNVDEDGDGFEKLMLKSSLKKPSSHSPVSKQNAEDCEALCKKSIIIPHHADKRKIQWTDACGSELVEIREFEPSEIDGSENDFKFGNDKKSCLCAIM